MVKLQLALWLLLASFSADAALTYVDGDNGNDGNSGLSWAAAWKNPGHVGSVNVSTPGSIQYIKASNYTYPNFFLQNLTGTANAHIQFIGVPGPGGHTPYIVQSSGGQTGGAYWPTNLHYVDVTNVRANNPTSLNPNGSCFFIGSTGGAANVDHITLGLPAAADDGTIVWGFIATDCGGNGVNAEYADYIDVENGIVANNGSTITTASPSGISYLSFCALDSAAGYHNIIRNNIVYGEASTNGSTVPSDYNGIIIDDMDNYQSAVCGHTVYTQKTLITKNIVFGNQGKGIHIWASMAGADVTYNTSYLNCQVSGKPCSVNDGDVDCLGASGHRTSNCNFYYNVITAPYYAININGLDPSTGTATANCNNEYGASGAKTANWDSVGSFTNTNFISVDPLLLNPQTTAPGSDFRPQPGVSPTIPLC